MVGRTLHPFLVLSASAGLLQACLFAAAGAGAAGGIYLTSRGAEVVVDQTVDQLATRTERVLGDRNITITDKALRQGGDEREYQGKAGSLDVTVKLNRRSPTSTKVEVTARRNLAEWDKSFAEGLLAEIVGN